MTLKFIDLYNDITGQAWSMFDSEVESKEDFEASVTTSIQKALAELWFSHDFSFRKKEQVVKTKVGVNKYEAPDGSIYRISGKFAVTFDDEYLSYVLDGSNYKNETGEPEAFTLQNDKLVVYPTPDERYEIKVGYLSNTPVCDVDDNPKYNFSEDNDYLNISEKYEDMFKNTLLPLAMVYLIASETDENYSAYMWQYERALKKLVKISVGINADRSIGW